MENQTCCLSKDGFELYSSVLDKTFIEKLQAELSSLQVAPGYRNLMKRVPAVAALAVSPELLNLIEERLDSPAFPVRSIFFDKTPEANWLVPWHQDLSIAVRQRTDVSGYGPWSNKDELPHVQPPVCVLEKMITLRIHLDDCDGSNGALRVIPGTHRLGKLSAAQIIEVRQQQAEVLCCAAAGDALLMRPLLLHASSSAIMPTHRRVIHIEYASVPLQGGLEWAEQPTPSAR